MSETISRQVPRFVARSDQPLIAIPVDQDGEEQIHYFVDDAAADAALGQAGQRPPIKLAGVWSDLDEDEVLASLDHIRHASTPPPLSDL